MLFVWGSEELDQKRDEEEIIPNAHERVPFRHEHLKANRLRGSKDAFLEWCLWL